MSLTLKRLSHWSWFSLEADHTTIHLDPAYLKAYGKPPEELGGPADFILYTHAHNDHCRKDTLPLLRGPGTTIVAPAACAAKIGGDFVAAKPGQRIALTGLSLLPVEAYNPPGPGKIWHKKGAGVGYLLTIGGVTVYHAGDTGFIPEMGGLGHVDIALLPIGGHFTMDAAAALAAANVIRPSVVIPMHHLREDQAEFKRRLEAAIPGIRTVVLERGEKFSAA